MKVDINILKEHPLNHEIYSDDDTDEQFTILVNRIKESGWIDPVIVNNEYVILSGHRRVRAAKLLGYTTIEYEMVNVEPDREVEILLDSNLYREKTTLQKTKEGEFYHVIESRKARDRQLSGTTLGFLRTQGRTDEIVAEKTGMSTSSYRRARQVLKNTEKIADPAMKWLLEETLNEDITAAQKLSEKPTEFIKQVHDLVDGDVKQVGKVIRNLEKAEIKQEIPLPTGKYNVIYTEYGQEELEKCSRIPLGDLAEPDSVLFLWTLPHFLDQAMRLIHHWEFQYKTAFLWNKDVMNECSDLGEVMLIATKGNPPMIALSSENQPITEKPKIVKEMIEQVYQPAVDKVIIHLGEGWEQW
jgi:ParB-like chromosome segregation protein Spo0J